MPGTITIIKLIMAHYADTVEFMSPFVNALLDKPGGKIIGKTALEAYPRTAENISFARVYNSENHLLAEKTMEINTEGKVIRVLPHYKTLARSPYKNPKILIDFFCEIVNLKPLFIK